MNEEIYWQKLIDSRANPNHIVVNGSHYTFSPEKPATPRHWRGTNGDRYHIKFKDGRVVISTNVWHQGPVPAHLRDQLPDNAEFVKEMR